MIQIPLSFLLTLIFIFYNLVTSFSLMTTLNNRLIENNNINYLWETAILLIKRML